MPDKSRVVGPGPRAGTVRDEAGEVLGIPAGWVLLPPGDAALTGRVKRAGPVWTVQEKRGRKLFSRGLYASAECVERIRTQLVEERKNPAHARKLEAGRARRAEQQQKYVEDFVGAVESFLGFAPRYQELARDLARAIADHATPVGSGTVARTERIPIGQRAEAATIAWLRHATTDYDDMQIPRIKGMRRDVRRLLAERSRALLTRYRRGEVVPVQSCTLLRGLARSSASQAATRR